MESSVSKPVSLFDFITVLAEKDLVLFLPFDEVGT